MIFYSREEDGHRTSEYENGMLSHKDEPVWRPEWQKSWLLIVKATVWVVSKGQPWIETSIMSLERKTVSVFVWNLHQMKMLFWQDVKTDFKSEPQSPPWISNWSLFELPAEDWSKMWLSITEHLNRGGHVPPVDKEPLNEKSCKRWTSHWKM